MDAGHSIGGTVKMWFRNLLKDTDPQSNLIRYGGLIAYWYVVASSWWMLIPGLVLGFGFTGTQFFMNCVRTWRRDFRAFFMYLLVRFELWRRNRANQPLHRIWLERVKAHPKKECLVEVETGRRIKYGEINDFMNKFANYFKTTGCVKDDVVALFMENCIDFYALWMGLSKLGVITAWVNTNLKLEPLAYSIKASRCRAIVTTTALLPTLRRAIAEGLVDADLPIYINEGAEEANNNEKVQTQSLTTLTAGSSTKEPPRCKELNFQDTLCYIYTSGTTGNPKPAIVKHHRYYWGSFVNSRVIPMHSNDRIYNVMPIYHSGAGILTIGSTITSGTTVVLRKKFSASHYWKDVVEHQCTCSQYIGEICRYLLMQPRVPEERQHKMRMLFGNGLRPAIWEEVQSRFGIKQIAEFYASTEGNANSMNIDGRVGAAGFIPIYPFTRWFYPITMLRVNEETHEILRDKNGLAIPCSPGQVGELIGIIRNELFCRFDGYVDTKDTTKKIYKDVFKKGDQAFSTGDIMLWDERGYLFFKDRLGDTYRWKGENVSTMEVEGILQPVTAIEDCSVYGVEVGTAEGRAGMAAIHPAEGVKIEDILLEASQRYSSNLASYAIPLFIRIVRGLEKTATYKLKKLDLQKQGYDLAKCGDDPIYFWSGGKYIPLTPALQKQLDAGQARI